MNKQKLIRITTIPVSLGKLLGGQLRFMSQFYNVVGVSSDSESLSKVGIQEGVEVKAVEMTRQITPVKDLKSVYDLYKYFKKEKPLIVHTHTPKAGTVGMLAAKLAGVPNRFHTIAGLPLLEAVGAKRKILNLVEKLTYACATKIYPNSSGLKEIILQEKFCEPKKLKVIGNGSSNGINTSFFDSSLFSLDAKNTLKAQLDINQSDFVFIFVGRLVADKGINELVSAFEQVCLQNTNVKLLLVGKFEKELDPLQQSTMKIIEEEENIIRVGFQQDVRPYFAISEALVFPSYREGFPNVVMQAGAMGLPSIVTDINGCNEIINHQENGLVIPLKSATAVKNAMLLLADNNKLYQKLKTNARKRITGSYEQSVVWNAILEEYKTVESNV